MNCKQIKNNKHQCKAKAQKDSEYCFFHDPNSKAQRKIAQSSGGAVNNAVNLNLAPVEITTPNDLTTLLVDTINRVRSGELNVKVANCIGVLSGQLLKTLELTTVQQRIEIIEKVILERKN